MINEKIEKALNEQINAELYSSYLYLSMSAYFDTKSLGGFSNWMKIQAQEEISHAMIMFNYVAERGGRVTLKTIEGPKTEWASPLEVFEAVYNHEVHVTSLINKVTDLSREVSDNATYNFMQWFVGEQVEEEAGADEMFQALKLVGDNGHGMLMLDREAAARAFVMPAALGGGA